jgi:ribosomal protein S18 acetylase RimI-like enzyme
MSALRELTDTYQILTTAADARFDALYAIYCDAIAVREQKAKAELSAMVSRPGYRFLLSEKNNTVVAFSISFVATDGNFCLLEYMAVDKKYRGRGVGSELFEETVKSVYRQQAAMPILLEIDSDRQLSREYELRRRRQNFYRRLGCRRIADCAYILPLPGEGPPPEMDLFVYVPEPQPTIRRDNLRRWLQRMYRDVYGCSADDPRISMMLQGVPDPVELV